MRFVRHDLSEDTLGLQPRSISPRTSLPGWEASTTLVRSEPIQQRNVADVKQGYLAMQPFVARLLQYVQPAQTIAGAV